MWWWRAAAFGYNEKYISHRFAQICGIPLKQYILKTKMDTASFMLIDTNEPITEIAKAVGFSDSHNGYSLLTMSCSCFIRITTFSGLGIGPVCGIVK